MKEKSQLHFILEYFRNLGYSPAKIKFDVRVKTNVADIVVYENDIPFIVVEYKPFNKLTNEQEMKYNPYITHLQLIALACKAPYYVLTNGQTFLWFQTDNTGFPKLLKEPIRGNQLSVQVKDDKEKFYQTFEKVLYALFFKFDYSKRDLAILLFGWLKNNRELVKVKENLLKANLIKENTEIYPILNVLETSHIDELFEMLYSVNIDSLTSEEILTYLDDKLFKDRKMSPRLPRWLADFLVRLSNLKNDTHLVELFGGNGNILTNAIMKDMKLESLTGIYSNHEDALWSNIQQLILEKGATTRQITNNVVDPIEISHLKIPTATTNIISMPPIGGYVKRIKVNQRIYDIPSLTLEVAIKELAHNGRIVMIVPENLLFESGRTKKYLRELLIQNVRLTAIISLPGGTFLPYSGVKTSILVLDKVSYNPDNFEVFMAQIKKPVLRDVFDCRGIKEINNVLEAFESDREIKEDYYFKVSVNNLDINNFTVIRYIPSELLTHPKINFSYTKVQLKEITIRIMKGRGLKTNEDIGLPVIVPSAIRPMSIRMDKIRYTKEKVNDFSTIVQTSDIVFSSAGPFLGAAAIITDEMKGKIVNHDVILIRPDLSKVLPEYLAAALNSDFVRQQLQTNSIASSIPRLSIGQLDDIKIPLPSMETQHQICEYLEMKRNEFEISYKAYKNAEFEFLSAVQRLEGGELK